MNTIWLKIGIMLLSRLSGPIKDYLEVGFDKLGELAAGTANKVDDKILNFIRFVVLGGVYETNGTGAMETVVASLMTKLSLPARKSFYDLLVLAKTKADESKTLVDDIAVQFLTNMLFPDGDPGADPLTIESAVSAAEASFSETSKAPGAGRAL
jgi:hypothetical protein